MDQRTAAKPSVAVHTVVMEFIRKSKFLKPVMFTVAGLAAVAIAAPVAISGINERSMDDSFAGAIEERKAALEEYNDAFDAYEAEVDAAYDTANVLGADDPLVKELVGMFEMNEEGESTLEPRLTVYDPPEQAASLAEVGIQVDTLLDEARQLRAGHEHVIDLTEDIEAIRDRLEEAASDE